MLDLPPAGAAINADDANNYISQHVKTQKSLKEILSTIEGLPDDVRVHYNDESNAFLFDIDLIRRLIEERDSNDQRPQYLMVTLAEKYQVGEPGIYKPTIVLAGVRYDDKNDSYYRMSFNMPALQQSPPLQINGFPAPLG